MLIIIPILLILGFILFGRKHPVYILGVPLVYAFWEAVFIPGFDWHISFGSLVVTSEDVLFGLFFFAWAYISLQRRPIARQRLHLEIILMLLLMVLLGVEVLLSWIAKGNIALGVVLFLRPYIYWPLGLFMWMGIMRRVTTDEILRFIRVISWITVGLTVLYIFSAIGAPIYPGERYQVIETASGIVVRDFITFPYWSTWAIFFFVLEISFSTWSQKSLFQLLGTCILMTGLVMNLTRSLVFSVLFILGLFAVFILIKGSRRQKRFVGSFGLALFGLFILLTYYTPANISVFIDRVQGLQGGIVQSTLGLRIDVLTNLIHFIQVRDPIFGVGFYTLSTQSPVTYWGDVMWLRILYDLGWIGTSIFFVFMLISLLRSIKNVGSAITADDKILSWLFFMVGLLYLLMTMTSESYTVRYSISMLAAAGNLIMYDCSWRLAFGTKHLPLIINREVIEIVPKRIY